MRLLLRMISSPILTLLQRCVELARAYNNYYELSGYYYSLYSSAVLSLLQHALYGSPAAWRACAADSAQQLTERTAARTYQYTADVNAADINTPACCRLMG